MALSEEKIRGYVRRLLISRMRLLCNHGFFGLLLMHMRYAVDESVPTACTDGQRIIFGTDFLDDIDDDELDFVMMHEVMHVVLRHCTRGEGLDDEKYNIAADIVVNSNILLENGMDLSKITLSKYGESMHLAPDGKEGHLYTAEEVYAMLPDDSGKKNKNGGSNNRQDKSGNSGGSSSAGGKQNNGSSAKGAGGKQNGTSKDERQGKGSGGSWDDHSRWGEMREADEHADELWVKRAIDAAEAIEIRDAAMSRGTLPLFAKRLLKELRQPQTDWRKILCEFVQEEINDYSFFPPDRRFDDNPFYLPDFNEKDEKVEKILFMIDTSGSMSDAMISAAYSEVKGALDQFNGKLEGWLGFFDAAIVEPEPFANEEEFSIIKPVGGGGTSFSIIFEYVSQFMKDDPPVSIIILTDGYAPFPKEAAADGIPVLWLLNNE